MIPKCLNGVIGLRDCNAGPALLYLNDLEGITLKTAALISGDTGIKLLEACIERGIALTIEEFGEALRRNVILEPVADISDCGRFTQTFLPLAPKKRGVRIRRGKSRLQKIRIYSVNVLVNTDGPAEITLLDGNNVFTYPFTAQAGIETEVIIDYKAEGEMVYLLMDNAVVSPALGTIQKHYCHCSECDGGFHGSGRKNKLEIKGWDGTQSTETAYGILPNVLLECDPTYIFCLFKERFKYVFLYRAAVEFAKHWSASNRTNEKTIYENDKAKALQRGWQGDYERRATIIAEQISRWLTEIDDDCITCSGYTYGHSI